ncbi:hypothetical protein QBC38DRAFT_481662 [Podospora fimiseda]|uniref:2EXR domain-containing protein n=1 Tax=Podospora fimiseda TaxID=252190 RepID=A0AAN7BM87_9PEZI|nr:hypothetical protein QBC38DRAFT_481662 [Podospora fimiseda]
MEFTVFPELPAEIRQKIWRLAALDQSYSPAIGNLQTMASMEFQPGVDKTPKLMVQPAPNRALLVTNTEAHEIALLKPQPARSFNPDTNVLYICCSSVWDDFFNKFSDTRRSRSPRLDMIRKDSGILKVRHIALSMRFASLDYWKFNNLVPQALGDLHKLEKISIVKTSPSICLSFLSIPRNQTF